ncbi:carbon-monoxide dehydrogenase medium subunit [Bradyrhizobium lablabi]|uniref:Carbon-monoxide dehydrogenase medium subunit n=2 Tax=Bradyrhizobium lablabi TaxID=722472 RepID=A0A1M6V856_9BRAD|nr:carbon-monoxide dehydrogenase medium subunit [Bradyrhizobium lablabi]
MGKTTIGAKHGPIGFSDSQKAPGFFDLRRVPSHTLRAASRWLLREARFVFLHASAMKPAPFKYIAATSLAHALALKAEHGDEAKFLAGGQSLMPAMNFRLARPAILIDINEIEDLAGIGSSGAATRIGPLTRYRALQRDAAFARAFPLIAEALPHIAHPQIRNRGTIGGNLSHADPASELPAVALALRARFRVQTAKQERWIEAPDFFVGALTTDLGPDEMLVEIELPPAKPRTGSCFMEIARRRGDFAIAGVAAMVKLGDKGECSDVRLAFCGVGETPVDAGAAAGGLIGHTPTEAAIRDVAASVQAMIDPGGNVHATADYQRHIAGVLTERALQTAYQRGRDGH